LWPNTATWTFGSSTCRAGSSACWQAIRGTTGTATERWGTLRCGFPSR
jgi:hypothetical protein